LSQTIHYLGTVTAVTVEEYDDLAIGSERSNPGCTSPAVASPWFGYDARPSQSGAFSGGVSTAVVDDDYFADLTWNRLNDVGDGLFFI
jgi:hypothetical protein